MIRLQSSLSSDLGTAIGSEPRREIHHCLYERQSSGLLGNKHWDRRRGHPAWWPPFIFAHTQKYLQHQQTHEQTFLAAATNIVSSNHKDLQNRSSSSLIDLQWRANYLATHV